MSCSRSPATKPTNGTYFFTQVMEDGRFGESHNYHLEHGETISVQDARLGYVTTRQCGYALTECGSAFSCPAGRPEDATVVWRRPCFAPNLAPADLPNEGTRERLQGRSVSAIMTR